jgi:hypothetical protein
MATDIDPADLLPDVVDTWVYAITALDAQRAELAAAGETGMLAFGLDRIRELRRQLGDLERAVEADVATLMDGVDPDEWCETKPGRTSVQIHKGEAA